MTYTIWFDGGCKPNPGQGYGSWQIRDPDEALIQHRQAEQYGYMTNNMAEYMALTKALEWLIAYGLNNSSLQVRSDSRLVVEQVCGTWRVKNPKLKPCVDWVRELLSEFQFYEIFWNPRVENLSRFGH